MSWMYFCCHCYDSFCSNRRFPSQLFCCHHHLSPWPGGRINIITGHRQLITKPTAVTVFSNYTKLVRATAGHLWYCSYRKYQKYCLYKTICSLIRPHTNYQLHKIRLAVCSKTQNTHLFSLFTVQPGIQEYCRLCIPIKLLAQTIITLTHTKALMKGFIHTEIVPCYVQPLRLFSLSSVHSIL